MSLIPVFFCDESFKTLRTDDKITADGLKNQVLDLIDLSDYKEDFGLVYLTSSGYTILNKDDDPLQILKDSFVQYPPKPNDPKLLLMRIFDLNPDEDFTDPVLNDFMINQAMFLWRRGWLILNRQSTELMASIVFKKLQNYTPEKPLPAKNVLLTIISLYVPQTVDCNDAFCDSVLRHLKELPPEIKYTSLPIPAYARGAIVFPSILLRNGKGKKTRIDVLVTIRSDKITIVDTNGDIISQFEFESIIRYREESPDLVLEISLGGKDTLFLLFTSANSGSIMSTLMEYAGRKLQLS